MPTHYLFFENRVERKLSKPPFLVVDGLEEEEEDGLVMVGCVESTGCVTGCVFCGIPPEFSMVFSCSSLMTFFPCFLANFTIINLKSS